ncbi:hypothetical protein DDI_0209 [Dickeya dianthicola RNS04.9]|nr:hypothetical protein DDI_0209 [Dickeya dianthicola RNS04.9]
MMVPFSAAWAVSDKALVMAAVNSIERNFMMMFSLSFVIVGGYGETA